MFEVGKLYKSVSSMYVALRSFKKYVPIQVVSNIIKSEVSLLCIFFLLFSLFYTCLFIFAFRKRQLQN